MPLSETSRFEIRIAAPSQTESVSAVSRMECYASVPWLARPLARVIPTEAENLIRKGNKHMREGDILQARELYLKAVSLGEPEAALAMGRSYDPIYFPRIEKKKNAEPDPPNAFDWYKKAMDAGLVATANVHLQNLTHYLEK
jgi:TPR repeat protein